MFSPTTRAMLSAIGFFCAGCVGAADPEFVLGKVTQDIRSGRLESYCATSKTNRHMQGDSLIVAGVHTCKLPYSSRTEDFYEVITNDEIAYVPRTSLFVTDERRKFLEEIAPDAREAFITEAKKVARSLRLMELDDLLKAVDKTRPKGLALLDYSAFDVSEHTEGTGFKFSVLNPSKKTVKYVAVTVIGLNAVNDPVRTLRGSTTATVRGVGPIAPEENSSYSFDYVWHTDLVESVRIVSIKVDYMDGSTRVIPNAREITLTDRQVNVLNR